MLARERKFGQRKRTEGARRPFPEKAGGENHWSNEKDWRRSDADGQRKTERIGGSATPDTKRPMNYMECLKRAKGQRPTAGGSEKPDKGGGKGEGQRAKKCLLGKGVDNKPADVQEGLPAAPLSSPARRRRIRSSLKGRPSSPSPGAGDGSAHPRNGRRDPRKDILSGDPREDILSGLPHLSSSAP